MGAEGPWGARSCPGGSQCPLSFPRPWRVSHCFFFILGQGLGQRAYIQNEQDREVCRERTGEGKESEPRRVSSGTAPRGLTDRCSELFFKRTSLRPHCLLFRQSILPPPGPSLGGDPAPPCLPGVQSLTQEPSAHRTSFPLPAIERNQVCQDLVSKPRAKGPRGVLSASAPVGDKGD